MVQEKEKKVPTARDLLEEAYGYLVAVSENYPSDHVITAKNEIRIALQNQDELEAKSIPDYMSCVQQAIKELKTIDWSKVGSPKPPNHNNVTLPN